MIHSNCNRCLNVIEGTKGPCVFSNPGPASEEGEKEEFTMSKGYHFVTDGKVYRTTTPEAKRLLKAVIKGEKGVPKDDDEIAPVIDLDKLDAESATKEFLKIEMA